MRGVVLGAVLIASAGCAVMAGLTTARRCASRAARVPSARPGNSAAQRPLSKRARPGRPSGSTARSGGAATGRPPGGHAVHFKRNVITCYLNHFYEDFTPKSLMAAVAEADAGLGSIFRPNESPRREPVRHPVGGGQFMVSIGDACRREFCAAVEERRREVEGKGLIYMDASGVCDDASEPRRPPVGNGLIIAALIFLPPLGIWLAWARSSWAVGAQGHRDGPLRRSPCSSHRRWASQVGWPRGGRGCRSTQSSHAARSSGGAPATPPAVVPDLPRFRRRTSRSVSTGALDSSPPSTS